VVSIVGRSYRQVKFPHPLNECFPGDAKQIESGGVRQKPAHRREGVTQATPGLQPDYGITWEQVRSHVLCVPSVTAWKDRSRLTSDSCFPIYSSFDSRKSARFGLACNLIVGEIACEIGSCMEGAETLRQATGCSLGFDQRAVSSLRGRRGSIVELRQGSRANCNCRPKALRAAVCLGLVECRQCSSSNQTKGWIFILSPGLERHLIAELCRRLHCCRFCQPLGVSCAPQLKQTLMSNNPSKSNLVEPQTVHFGSDLLSFGVTPGFANVGTAGALKIRCKNFRRFMSFLGRIKLRRTWGHETIRGRSVRRLSG